MPGSNEKLSWKQDANSLVIQKLADQIEVISNNPGVDSVHVFSEKQRAFAPKLRAYQILFC